MENALAALNTIRHFQGRIENPTECRKVQDRANDLEAAISAFGAHTLNTTQRSPG
jgi:hypothetical protein